LPVELDRILRLRTGFTSLSSIKKYMVKNFSANADGTPTPKEIPLLERSITNCMLVEEDQRMLYAIGFASAGHVLELGPFCGCSTVQVHKPTAVFSS
jgi:hypothetical protein